MKTTTLFAAAFVSTALTTACGGDTKRKDVADDVADASGETLDTAPDDGDGLDDIDPSDTSPPEDAPTDAADVPTDTSSDVPETTSDVPGDVLADTIPDVDVDRGLACTPELARLAAESRCRGDDDCPCGAYCDLGLCRYDCLTHEECPDDGICDRFGRCREAELADAPPPLAVVTEQGRLVLPRAALVLSDETMALPLAATGRDVGRTRVIASAGLRVVCSGEPGQSPAASCLFGAVPIDAAPRVVVVSRDPAVALPDGAGYVQIFTAGASVEATVTTLGPPGASPIAIVGPTALRPGIYEGVAEPAEVALALPDDHAFWRVRVPITLTVYDDLVVELDDPSHRVVPGGSVLAAALAGAAPTPDKAEYTLRGGPAALVTSGSPGDPRTVQVTVGPFDAGLTYWDSGRIEADLTLPLGPFGEVASDVLMWDFEDGTLQGWTALYDDATNGMRVGTATNGLAAGGGQYALEPESYATREGAHDRIVYRSPAFYLDPSQDIVVSMLGGRAAGANTSGFYPADVDGLATSTSAASGQKKMGFAVRRVSDGAYVAYGQRSTASDTAWEAVTVPGATLAHLAFEAVTIDVYDALSAPWGWIAVDSVAVGGRLVSPDVSHGGGRSLFSTSWRLVLARAADLPAGAAAPTTKAAIEAAHAAGLAALPGLLALDRPGPTRRSAEAFTPPIDAELATFEQLQTEDLLACTSPTPEWDLPTFWSDYGYWLSERPDGFAEQLSAEIRWGLLMSTTKHYPEVFWATFAARERTINGVTYWLDNLHTWISDAMRRHTSGVVEDPGLGTIPCAGRFRTRSWITASNSACCDASCIPAYTDCIAPEGCETFDFCDAIDAALREAGEPGCLIEGGTYERPLFTPSGHCWRLPNAVGSIYNATNGAGEDRSITAQVEITVTRQCRQPGGASALLGPRPLHCAEGVSCADTLASREAGAFDAALDPFTDDLTCGGDAASFTDPLVGLLGDNPPVGEAGLDACVADLEDLGTTFDRSACLSKGRLLLALDHALAGVDGRASADPAAGRLAHHLLLQLLGVQAFVANELRGRGELEQVLSAADDRPCEFDFDAELDRLAASIDAWDILLHPNVTDALRTTRFALTLGTPDPRADHAGTAPAPTRPAGLPVAMAETLRAQAESLSYFVRRARLAQEACAVEADFGAHGEAFAWRASLALALMRELAERTVEVAEGAEVPWLGEWETAYARALSAVGGLNQALDGLDSDKNPLGIEDVDLPLYFSGDETTANERFGAISRFLMGVGTGGPELAPRYVAAAQTALATARDAWIAQADRSIAARRSASDLAARTEDIRRRYGTPIQDACGLSGTSFDVLDRDVDPDHCYIAPSCAWSPADQAERASVGNVAANLCMLSRLRSELGEQVTSRDEALDALADSLLPQFLGPVADLQWSLVPAAVAGGANVLLRNLEGQTLYTFALRQPIAVGTPLVQFVIPRGTQPAALARHGPHCVAIKGRHDALRPDDLPGQCQKTDQCPLGMFCSRGICGVDLDPIDNLAGICFQGTLGEMRARLIAAKLAVAAARQRFAEFADRYDIMMQSCAIRMFSDLKIQRMLEKHNHTMDALGAVKLTADITANIAEGTKDCVSTTNESGLGGLLSGGTTAAVACGAAAVEQAAESLSDGMTFAMDKAVRDHEAAVAELESTADLAICQNDASLALVGARSAAIEIQQAFADMQVAYLEFRNTQASVLSLLEEGRLALRNEEARYVPPLEHDLWIDEAVDRFHRVMRLARRMTYLAVRAVEYEFQYSSSERGEVMAATHPDVLDAVVQSLETQLLTGGIDGKRPSLSPPTVVSLRDHLLQLGDAEGAPEWAQNMSPTERFVALITSPRYAVYSEAGDYLGQRIPFTLAAMDELDLGNDTVAPFFSRFSCAERLWAINVGLPGVERLDGRTFTNLIVEQRNTFYSQRCGEPGPNEDVFQVASVRPARNLFADPLVNGDAGLDLDDSTSDYLDPTQDFAVARIAARPVGRAELEDEDYTQGDSEELATRALFGDYAIFFPADELDGYGRPGGLRLHELQDVLIRFDYVSVAD
ncbi:MAG: hypothetical protein IT385_24870 [Deltaproteobacteria bacterium]|nr:hypothetical protein [Deltaproteobacteria bacterium]